MCGIVGYVGAKSALDVVLEGLRRLEYRGYDSAGVAVVSDGSIVSEKRAGKLTNLEKALAERANDHVSVASGADTRRTRHGSAQEATETWSLGDPLTTGTTGIGHTRWATHGPPNDVNAHPHLSADGSVAVIHNGIIENFAALRDELTGAGVEFRSDTDTEVVAHLLAGAYDEHADLAESLRVVCRRLEGAFTLLAVHRDHPELVVGARRSSPLVVGTGDGEYFLGSDVAAFIAHSREAIELGQDQVVTITRDGVTITDFHGAPAEGKAYHVDWDAAAAEKGGYPNFMLKEIADQPQAVADTLLGRMDARGNLALDELRMKEDELKAIDKIIIVACGTAYYSGLMAKYVLEHYTRIPCEVELASEFRYRDPILTHRTLVVAISQSGETMDTLMAVRHARDQGSRVLAICNTNGSTIPRESDAVLYTHAGPEIAVASTKAFLAQITASYLLGLYLGQLRGNFFADEVRAHIGDLNAVPAAIQEVLDDTAAVEALARELSDNRVILFLGRHVGYPVALEGALKLKELAYIHAEGFAAGELKHGPIALIEPGLPVFIIVPSPRGRGSIHDKLVSNIQEIRARGARTVVIAEAGDASVEPYADVLVTVPALPTLLAPLVTTVPLQVFACHLAMAKGHDVDQPRNLAKSVTVE